MSSLREVGATAEAMRAALAQQLIAEGKQVVLFYTQTKTVTARWFDDSTISHGVNTTISLK